MTSNEVLIELVVFIKEYMNKPRPVDMTSVVEPNSYTIGKNDAISEIMKKIVELAKNNLDKICILLKLYDKIHN